MTPVTRIRSMFWLVPVLLLGLAAVACEGLTITRATPPPSDGSESAPQPSTAPLLPLLEGLQLVVEPIDTGPAVPTMRELQVVVEPIDCGSVATAPAPVDGNLYEDGSEVTIVLSPAAGCELKRWVNATQISPSAATVVMDGDRVVEVALGRPGVQPPRGIARRTGFLGRIAPCRRL